MDWARAAERHSADSPAARVWRGVQHILSRRRATAALHGGVPTAILPTGIAGLFCATRRAPTGSLLGLYNFTGDWQHLPEAQARGMGAQHMHDALSDAAVTTWAGHIAIPPYGRLWLT
jgi:amylosucrase